MFVTNRQSVFASPRFWKFVIVTSIVMTLFYVMTDDLQEYHTIYMNKLTRPTNKHFVCLRIHGTQLERKLFEFAYSFGIAKRTGSSLIMSRDEGLRKVFELKPVKFLKKLTVCDSFEKITYPGCSDYNSNSTDLQKEKHYQMKSCDSSEMPSILDFDKHKHSLMEYLKFTQDVDKQAKQFFSMLVKDKKSDKPRTNIAIYLANSSNLAKALDEDHVDYMIKYVTVAINYYSTRIPDGRFIVYSLNTKFAQTILRNQNMIAVYIEDASIIETKPEVLMRVLSLCDHVITSGAADMFGWWVGYLSKGTVVYPRKYSDDSSNMDQSNKDIYPHSWIGLVF